VFENRVLRGIFGPKRDEVTGEWRKLHNEELHDLYYLFSLALQPSTGYGLLLDHTKRRATVGRTLLGRVISSSQRPLPDNTQNKHPCPGGTQTHDLSTRGAVDLRLRPRGHWDRLYFSPTIVRVIKLRMRWAGHVARMERGEACTGLGGET
jgi:hypothetical protein